MPLLDGNFSFLWYVEATTFIIPIHVHDNKLNHFLDFLYPDKDFGYGYWPYYLTIETKH